MNSVDIETFFATLQRANPSPASELHYASVFELLTAVLLSAQATDVGVNKATRTLFVAAPTPARMLALGIEGVEAHVRTIGLYRTKTKHLLETCRILIEQHGGEVPREREALAVDTHVFRVSNRTGLAPGKTPLAVELKLLERVPEKYLDDAHHWLILHGRYVCLARMPQCGKCAVAATCDWYKALPAAARPKPGEAAPNARALRDAGIEP